MMEERIVDSRYVLKEKVGAGGMADVYRAVDNQTGQEVAVKQMHTDLLNDPEFVRRFEREAVAQSMLNHQNIVATFGHGTDGDVPYIVMEYVDGITLKDFIQCGDITIKQGKSPMVIDMFCNSNDIIHKLFTD